MGVAVEVVRGGIQEDLFQSFFTDKMLIVPIAPGYGLFLENTYFDMYNKRCEGVKPPLVWDDEPYRSRREEFKKRDIVDFITTEVSTCICVEAGNGR